MRVQTKRDKLGEPLGMVFHVKWLAYGQDKSVLYSVGAEPVDVPDEVGRYFVRTYAQYVEEVKFEIPVAPTEPPAPDEVTEILGVPLRYAEKSEPARSRGRPKKT